MRRPSALLGLYAAIGWLTLTFGASTTSSAFKPEKLAAIDTAVAEAIAAKKLPGGVLWFEHEGQTYRKTYGHRTLTPTQELTTEDTIYDAASLTKVLATTTAVMQ